VKGPRLSLIVAMSANRVIGRHNGLPWHLPADLQRFRRLTMGHPLIVGRRTFEAIGRPLPGRRMIVVTRRGNDAPPGVELAGSLDEALALAAGSDEVFVGGGAEVFREALERADRLYLTIVEAQVEGDTWFPPCDAAAWRLVAEERHDADDRNPYGLRFLTCDRVRT
jgi:dihydrofolate reductase